MILLHNVALSHELNYKSAYDALLPSSMYQRWVHSLMVHGLIYAVFATICSLFSYNRFNVYSMAPTAFYYKT